jgi:hypothetical protein
MDPKTETRIARDVEKHLSRLLSIYPKLARLPIAPLFGVRDLIRLEIALERFGQSHSSARSKRLIEAVRLILSVARTRMRIASTPRRAVAAAVDAPWDERPEARPPSRAISAPAESLLTNNA